MWRTWVGYMTTSEFDLSSFPADLKIVLDHFDKSESEARTILSGLSDGQANWQPTETAWSVSQCVDHLGRTNSSYAACLLTALKDPSARNKVRREPISPGWFSRFFISSLEPPPRRKLRSPRKIVPASRTGRDAVLNAFLHSHDDLRGVIRDATNLDLNRIRFRNPFVWFLRFSVGAGLMIVTAHDRRHLWQARSVRETPGFPPG